MSNTRDALDNYGYTDDRSNNWKVTLTSSVAQAGGFGSPLPVNSTLPRWEHSQTKLRHVYIRTADKLHHDRIPCADLTQDIYNYGGSVDDIAGRDGWIVTGHRGESYTFT